MDTDMNIQKCVAFVTAVECGSFTAAAERLSYSQSGISRMIADLEHEWGVTLLERGRAGVRLTSDGMELLPYARELVEGYGKLQSQVDSMHGLESGIVRVGCFSSVATHWMPRIIGSLQKDCPGIDYELLLGDYREIEGWILEGRVDCGFLRLPTSAALDVELLEKDELLAVLPEGHALAALEKVPLEKLCEYPFMMLGRDGNTEVADIFSSAGLRPNVKFTTWDDYSIMSMVESGLGVAVLHSLILRRMPYRIATRPLAKPQYREICIATKKGTTLSLAAKKFLEYLDCR